MGAGPAIRQEMNGIAEAPGKTWFWELAAGVIDADRCIQCGICVAVCPSDSIGVGRDNLPALVKMCTGCSLCWDFCPRGGLRYEATWPEPARAGDGASRSAGAGSGRPAPAGDTGGSRPEPPAGDAGAARPEAPDQARPEPSDPGIPGWKITGSGRGEGLGQVRRSFTARARPQPSRAQDGGVVGAILVAALEAGDIDGALVARESPTEPWKGEAHLVRTPDEVLACGGSFYNQTMALAHLDLRGYDLPADPRLAVVGTPCEVQGIRAMQSRPWSRGSSRVDAVVLTVALLCTKSFDYEGLMLRQLRDRRGLDLAQVGKVDVIHGKMIVEDRQGATLVSEPVKDFHGAALKGCDECADFLGRAADVSVGSVGSPDGWSSVLVRTEAGARALERAGARLDLADLERPEALAKLDAYDRKVALASLRRDFDPDGPLFVDFEEHRVRYSAEGPGVGPGIGPGVGPGIGPGGERGGGAGETSAAADGATCGSRSGPAATPVAIGRPGSGRVELAPAGTAAAIAGPGPGRLQCAPAAIAGPGPGRLQCAPAETAAAKDLPVPPEPVEVARRARSLSLMAPAAWSEQAAGGQWIVEALWPWWRDALDELGVSRGDLAAIAAGYRQELWLWVAGERTWEQAASGLAGRVWRRAGATLGQAGEWAWAAVPAGAS